MANEVKLEAYYFQIKDQVSTQKKKKKASPYYHLGDVEGKDFLDMFKIFLVNHTKSHGRDKALKKSFSILSSGSKKDINFRKRYISGVIESGEYGVGSNIKNITGKTVHPKNSSESIDMPFYFLLFAPKGKRKAILLIQRTGVHGAYKVFERNLKKFIISRYKGLELETKTLLSTEVAKKILGGGVAKKVVLTRHVAKGDVFNSLGDGYSNDKLTDEGAEMQLVLTSRGKGMLNLKSNLDKFLDGKGISSFGIEDLGFTGSNFTTSVKVLHNSKYRTLDLSDSLKIKPYYDLESEKVKKDKDNHPIFSSINEISLGILEDIIEEENY